MWMLTTGLGENLIDGTKQPLTDPLSTFVAHPALLISHTSMAAAVIEAAAGAVARAGLKNQGKKRVFLYV